MTRHYRRFGPGRTSLQAADHSAADVRSGFSRILLDGSSQLSLGPLSQSLPSFSHQHPLQPAQLPPPSHALRHQIPTTRSSSLCGSSTISHPGTPFSNILLPPPPNPNIHPSSCVRPRANSVDESLGVPGQPPMKRSRGDRSREHDAERRAREERAAFSESVRPLIFCTLPPYLLTVFKANRPPTSSTRISPPPSVV